MFNVVEIKEDNSEILDDLYKGSAYTITGAGGELKEWFEGISQALNDCEIGNVKDFYVFNGAIMNKKYSLKGDKNYPQDLTFISFKLDGLNVSKLAIFKLKRGDRWFDDIVDNNARK